MAEIRVTSNRLGAELVEAHVLPFRVEQFNPCLRDLDDLCIDYSVC